MQAVGTSVRCSACHHTVGHRCLVMDGRDMLLPAQAGRLLLRLAEVLESAKAGAPEQFGTLDRGHFRKRLCSVEAATKADPTRLHGPVENACRTHTAPRLCRSLERALDPT